MPLLSRICSSLSVLDEVLPLRFERFAIFVLASVLSEGSPGSSFVILGIAASLLAVAPEWVRGRFAGGFEVSIEAGTFLCLWVGVCTVESPASSPEASRDDGCCSSVTEDFFIAVIKVTFLLRFPEPEDEGEDMLLEGESKPSLDRTLMSK
jgi:hypothetical protein